MTCSRHRSEPNGSNPSRAWLRLFLAGLFGLLGLLGCSGSTWLFRPGPTQGTPVPTRTPAPTFTPTPETILPIVVITPPVGATPGVVIVPPGVDPQILVPPPPTPTWTPTATPVPPGPTSTPTPTFTATPTPTPTPYIQVRQGRISLRTGPGVAYPLVAQLGPGIPVAVVGRNTEGDWLQICCVNGQSVWVAAGHVELFNPSPEIPLVVASPPPTPTWTPTPTNTPTPTPILYPFERAIGPQFFPTNNPFLTIWVKLFVGPLGREVPAEGYFLEVRFEGFERPPTNGVQASFDRFEWSAPPGMGNRVQYNLKYEYRPYNPPRAEWPGATPTPTLLELLGTGTWTVWVKDGAGNQLSEPVSFTTSPSNPNREIYIAWQRVR